VSTEIKFEDADGKTMSAQFDVSEGKITVTTADGRMRTVEINESMLSAETLARALLLQLHRDGRPDD
jgi:hypothetical protein